MVFAPAVEPGVGSDGQGHPQHDLVGKLAKTVFADVHSRALPHLHDAARSSLALGGRDRVRARVVVPQSTRRSPATDRPPRTPSFQHFAEDLTGVPRMSDHLTRLERELIREVCACSPAPRDTSPVAFSTTDAASAVPQDRVSQGRHVHPLRRSEVPELDGRALLRRLVGDRAVHAILCNQVIQYVPDVPELLRALLADAGGRRRARHDLPDELAGGARGRPLAIHEDGHGEPAHEGRVFRSCVTSAARRSSSRATSGRSATGGGAT